MLRLPVCWLGWLAVLTLARLSISSLLKVKWLSRYSSASSMSFTNCSRSVWGRAGQKSWARFGHR